MNKALRQTDRREFLTRTALGGIAASYGLTCAPQAIAAEPTPSASAPLTIAVVTGGHAYDVINFHALFRALPNVNAVIQHMDDFASSPREVRTAYDVVLFYIMLPGAPTNEDLSWYSGRPKEALEQLGATKQGILILHHALLAYPDWPVWSEIVGIENRKFWFHMDQKIHVEVADAAHPITAGLQPWDMVDETYTMADAGPGSHILLTVDHPRSMKTIGWTRQYKASRAFCLESGHDNQTWANPNFREVLRRGLFWCASES